MGAGHETAWMVDGCLGGGTEKHYALGASHLRTPVIDPFLLVESLNRGPSLPHPTPSEVVSTPTPLRHIHIRHTPHIQHTMASKPKSGRASPPPPPPPPPQPRPHIEAGLQPDAVYAAALSPWRDALRRSFVSSLAAESEWIGSMQRKYRSKGRDRFFFWSAVFGSE